MSRATFPFRITATALLFVAVWFSAPAQASSLFPAFDDENPDRLPELAICNTDYQVRQNFADAGFSRIYLGAPSQSKKMVQVKANLDGTTYLIDYNRCTEQIVRQRALR